MLDQPDSHVAPPTPPDTGIAALIGATRSAPAPRPTEAAYPNDEPDDADSIDKLFSSETHATVAKADAAETMRRTVEKFESDVHRELTRMRALDEAKRRHAQLPPPDEPDRGTPEWTARVKDRYATVDLAALLKEPLPPVQWLEHGFIAHGDYIALTSDAKAGKSLLTYNLAAQWATGHSALTPTALARPMRTLYLDAENGPRWQHNKLTAFDIDDDFAEHLDVVNFPALPPLDTTTGGHELLAMIDAYLPDVLVFDTVSRFVEGNENDASTWLAFYRVSISPIRAKYPDLTIIRLDHHGKNRDLGARGSSAKMSDIDVHFEIRSAATERNTLTLVCERSRNQHYDEAIPVLRKDTPLRHEIPTGMARKAAVAAVSAPSNDEEIQKTVDMFDRFAVPTDIGYKPAAAIVRKQGQTISTDIARLAQAQRRERGHS